jgi:hypothetical protein
VYRIFCIIFTPIQFLEWFVYNGNWERRLHTSCNNNNKNNYGYLLEAMAGEYLEEEAVAAVPKGRGSRSGGRLSPVGGCAA